MILPRNSPWKWVGDVGSRKNSRMELHLWWMENIS